MKLEFARGGRQFFFITLVVAERKPVLSQLTNANSRPTLTPLGEMTRAALMALHRVYGAITASDFVVMPDHLHFLMIANYERNQSLEPLFIAHRLADAIEIAAAKLAAQPPEARERTGAAAPETPTDQRVAERKLWAKRADYMAKLLQQAIATARQSQNLKVERNLHFGELVGGTPIRPVDQPTAGASGAAAPVRSVVFARDCFIELSFDSRQLAAIRHYIRLNPARQLWKLAHPDLFLCHRNIKTERLAKLAPRRFDGIGNLALLGSPFLFHVRLTLKKTLAEHASAIAEIVDKARHGMIPVSGFISPGEKEALRRLKAEPQVRFIKLLPFALPDRYDPSAEDSREIAADRMAIISPFTDTPAISSLEMRRTPAAAHAFRANCLAMNDIAAKLCGN